MTNIRSFKTTIIALALISLCPINVSSRELDARTTLLVHMSVARCLFLEGIMTSEEATKKMFKKLVEEEGISIERIEVLMKDKNLVEELVKESNEILKIYGGCVKMVKDSEKTTPVNKK